MTVLELRFPAGRYHATPWGRHVNEGAVEWPPSPWRIVRALIATWYLKARKDEEISEPAIRALADSLTRQAPVFHLPCATSAHTRHYMPYNEGKNEKTTKVFDTFIQLAEKEAVFVAWENVDLPPEQLDALKTLAARLGYFGRAESLVEGSARTGLPEKIRQTHSVAKLLTEDAPQPPRTELVRLLAPKSPEDYFKWREAFLKTHTPSADSKKKTTRKPKAVETPEESVVPPNMFAALHADTGKLQAAGWNLPPGAHYVNYTRPENAFAPDSKPRFRRGEKLPTVARYAAVSTVAPSITQVISVADRVHDALCKWSDQGKGRAAVFTGLGDDGKPRDDHAHAHIFCEANGARDAITHITVWATMGFDDAACLALRKLNKVWGHSGHDIRLVLHGIGQPNDFADCELFRSSKKWRSLTPFVSTRHSKTFRDGRPKMAENGWQIGSAGHDLLRLLALHPYGVGATIKQLDERELPFQFGNRNLRSLQFQTTRYNGNGNRGNSSGNAFTVTFSKEIGGPFALGYGSHFGLGLFVPVLAE
jgi:CRISPR-associated protein Csb2